MSIKSRIEIEIARALLALPAPVMRALAGAPVVREGRTLDAQAQLALRGMRASGQKRAETVPLAEARRVMNANGGTLERRPLPALARVEDGTLAGQRVRVYTPRGTPPPAGFPALLYLHGGGHTLGSLDSHHGVCAIACAQLDAVVFALDYPLAPEHPFPAAPDACTAAFRTLAHEAGARGLDVTRLAVGGDSAGANLAAVVTLDTHADTIRPRAQLLVYPVVDLTMSSASMQTFAKGFFLEDTTIAWFRDNYVGTHTDRREPRASPLFAPDVAGLPPAVVVTAGFDPLVDEGDRYAARLREAGVRVTQLRYDSLFHGFFNTSGCIHAARAAVDETLAALRTLLA